MRLDCVEAIRRGLRWLTPLCAALCFASTAQAQVPVFATSYDMLNGNTGSFNYWDESYNGAGNTALDNAPLTGGLGDLTDGVLASDNWNVVEAPAGPGPYVGWTLDPTITVNFANVIDFQQVRIHFDDSDGSGGVSAPSGVIINGLGFPIAEPAGSAPFLQTFDVSSLASTNTLAITLQRNNTWVFASELQFFVAGNGASAPEPGSGILIASALLAMGAIYCRRKA